MTRVYLTQAMEKIEAAAKRVIADVAEGDMLRTQLAILRRLAKYEPFNTIALRQQIAQRTIEAGNTRWLKNGFTTETQWHGEQPQRYGLRQDNCLGPFFRSWLNSKVAVQTDKFFHPPHDFGTTVSISL